MRFRIVHLFIATAVIAVLAAISPNMLVQMTIGIVFLLIVAFVLARH
jgi:hypothetical protein